MRKERLCDALTDSDYAAIGRAMVSFGFIEHELVRAASGILGKTSGAEIDTDISKRIVEKSVSGAFRRRAEFFLQVYRQKFGDDDWISNTEENLIYAGKIRDQFAHGIWQKAPDGNLSIEFFSRDAYKDNRVSDIMALSVTELLDLAEMNKSLAVVLYEKFGPLPDLLQD